MAKKRRKISKKKQTALIKIGVAVVVVIAFCFVWSRVAFKCDHCNKLTFGGGYKPNIIAGGLSDEDRICENCAKEEHKLTVGTGFQNLDEYKLDIVWFGSSDKEEK